jgi:hypothetical protein
MKDTLMKSDINTTAAIYMRINSTTPYLYESPQISVKADSAPATAFPHNQALASTKPFLARSGDVGGPIQI